MAARDCIALRSMQPKSQALCEPMNRVFFAFSLALICGACAVKPIIPVVSQQSEVADCKKLGVVKAEGRSLENIEAKLIKAAHKKGGNLLLFHGEPALEITLHAPRKKHLNAFGEAYFCNRYNST